MTNKASDILQKITRATRDLSFTDPTEDQRRAKSQFWSLVGQEGVEVPPGADLATALRLGASGSISKWWGIPGFPDWFLNNQEFRERLEFLSNLALDTLEEIAKSKATAAPARINAAKLILEMADKFPRTSTNVPDAGDGKIREMNREQLQAFINSKLLLVSPSTSPVARNTHTDTPQVLTVEATPVTNSSQSGNK